MDVLNRDRPPWMWEAGGACVLGSDGRVCAVTIASVAMTTSSVLAHTRHTCSSHLVSFFFIWAGVLVYFSDEKTGSER